METPPTDKNIIPDFHGVVVHLAPTDATWRLDHAAGGNNRTAPDTDAGWRDFFARLGRGGARGMQVAS